MWKVNKVRGPWQTEALSERKDKTGQRRPLIIEIEPLCIVLRPKGTRQRFRLTHAKVYEMAVMAHADANRKRKPTIKRGVR